MITNDDILTDIYVVTNTETGKKYVGQANSHRLNNKVYRPFGYEGRFRDHISEALCNTKKKQCTMLNNSIRKYGRDKFVVELLERCLPEHANDREEHWINEIDTMSPQGYNLAKGGRKGNVAYEQRVATMHNTIKQFQEAKLKKYGGVALDLDKLDQYIYENKGYGGTYYTVRINGIKSIFVGKYMSIQDLKQQAVNFVKTLYERQLCNTTKLRESP